MNIQNQLFDINKIANHINIQPPYFAFNKLWEHEDTLFGSFITEQPLINEIEPIAGGEMGRHMAILGISADMAMRLSLALDTSPKFWLNLQVQYDLWIANQQKRPEIRLLFAFASSHPKCIAGNKKTHDYESQAFAF